MVVELAHEGTTNPGTLLVDGVQHRVRHILNALYCPVTQSIWFQFHINLRQLLAIT